MSRIKLVIAAAAFVLSLPAVAGAADRATVSRNQGASPSAFPNLSTIYVASGVRDNGGAINTGVATSFHCTNWTATT